MSLNSRICAYIDLDAVNENFDRMSANLKDKTPIAAVIKADGYGHGAIPIGKILEERQDVWGYAVATAEEGEALREAGLKKPIMLLGYVFPENYERLFNNDLRACVFSYETAKALSDMAVLRGQTLTIHIAVDTGMSRIGYGVTTEAADEVAAVSKLPHLVIEGIFTHFARADELSDAPADKQLAAFLRFVEMVSERGVDVPLVHAGNSAAILKLPQAHLSMVRAGITLYGMSPSQEVPRTLLNLKPVMSLVSHISYVKTLEAGCAVSYGGTYVTERETKVATIPVGYADGYPRGLSNKGQVLIHGQRVPIIGRVCMDQFMVDVTSVDDEVAIGDEVVLLGTQGQETITAEELGNLSGRFNYELTCDINKRVPRLYRYHGEIIGQVDYFPRK